MATSSSFLLSRLQVRGLPASLSRQRNFSISENSKCFTTSKPCSGLTARSYGTYCFFGITEAPNSTEITFPSLESIQDSLSSSGIPSVVHTEVPRAVSEYMQRLLLLGDLDPPATAKAAIGILGPFLSVFQLLFIIRIVMSWYPKLPVGKFPYVLVYAPTEPILNPTRKVIPPLGGVDVTPVVWFALISFMNEILLGPQGLLVLISQQV